LPDPSDQEGDEVLQEAPPEGRPIAERFQSRGGGSVGAEAFLRTASEANVPNPDVECTKLGFTS